MPAFAEMRFFELLALSFGFFAALTLVSLASGFALERAAHARGRRIFAVALKKHQLRTELVGTIAFVAVHATMTAGALASGWIRFTSGWLAHVVTFVACYVAFQVFYYAMHRAMHAKALFWIHRWHHESLVTTPLAGLSMHPLEALGWSAGMLAPGVVLAQLDLLGWWGWIAFFAFHFWGNIVGHANAELFPQQASKAASLGGNPILYHALHHARFDGHYGFGAAYMDRIFGTEWPDWIALVRRVESGKPLESLRERADAP